MSRGTRTGQGSRPIHHANWECPTFCWFWDSCPTSARIPCKLSHRSQSKRLSRLAMWASSSAQKVLRATSVQSVFRWWCPSMQWYRQWLGRTPCVGPSFGWSNARVAFGTPTWRRIRRRTFSFITCDTFLTQRYLNCKKKPTWRSLWVLSTMYHPNSRRTNTWNGPFRLWEKLRRELLFSVKKKHRTI